MALENRLDSSICRVPLAEFEVVEDGYIFEPPLWDPVWLAMRIEWELRNDPALPLAQRLLAALGGGGV